MIGFIEDYVDACDRTVVVGDFNFPCVTSHAGFTQCQPVFDKLDIAHCDDLIITPNPISFVNGLGYSSFIAVTTALPVARLGNMYRR